MNARGCNRTVLVVEDDHDVREAIAEVLADSQYQAVPAANGAEALRQLRAARVAPCLILLDVMMPVMDGWQFRAEQQRDAKVKDIPVVVLSAHADAGDAAVRMSAVGYLSKPVALEQLLSMVERFCAVEPESEEECK